MIKQAHSYLVGALSGVTLIGIAIAVFVVLVSAQVFHELPIVNVSSPERKADAVSLGKALPAGNGATVATTGGKTKKASGSHAAHHNGRAIAAAPTAGNAGNANGPAAESGALAVVPAPTTGAKSSPSVGGGVNPTGGNSGSHSSHPTKTSPSQTPSSSESGAGAGTTSGSSGSSGASSGSSGGASGSSGSAGSSSSSGAGSSAGGVTSGPVTATTKPAKGIEETVDGTVGAVNEVTGGALESTGVTEVTEKVTESVIGPESIGGKTVEGVAEAVGGLIAH